MARQMRSLLIETAIASGIFEIEGGPITYLTALLKKLPAGSSLFCIGSTLNACVRQLLEA